MSAVDPMPGEQRAIALHGFTGRGAAWDSVAAALGSGYRVEAPDLPGHRGLQVQDLGGSGPADRRPASFQATVDLVAREVLGWRADVAPDRCAASSVDRRPVLVGYSLGARLALGLLAEYGEHFAGAVLIGVRPGLDPADAAARARADDALAATLSPGDGRSLEAFVDRWQSLPLFSTQARLPAALRERQRRQRLSHDPVGLAWALRTLSPGRMPDYRARLGSIHRPVTSLVGALDDRFLALSQDLAAGLPRGSFAAVADAGHNLPLEAPVAVAHAIRGVIRGRVGDESTASTFASRSTVLSSPTSCPRTVPERTAH